MTVSTVDAPVEALEADSPVAGRSLRQIVWSRLRRDRVAMASMAGIAFIILVAVFAPLITRVLGVDPYTFNPDLLDPATGSLPRGALGQGFSAEHPLGVEPSTGRDILARLLYGARISLLIALTATLIAVGIGTALGIMAGYLRGWVDSSLGFVTDIVLSFPLLLALIALTPVAVQRLEAMGVPPGNAARITYLILALSLFGWPYMYRIARGQVLSLREREFVEAAESIGASGNRILWRELLPNLWAPILVVSTILLPTYIITEASLSFLGVGVQIPEATWGNMLQDSVRYFTVIPLYMFIPGTVLLVTVIVFNLLGDAVRDAVDPRAGRS
jgi:peptide/nickel transport system permease protein